MQIIRYDASKKIVWDEFVKNSKNGNFIFFRDYMEYHQQRFHDHSLMIYDEDKLVALLPGHDLEQVYYSHNGLTYGGFLTDQNMKAPLMLKIFDEAVAYLKNIKYNKWLYKTIPYIHHKIPAEEDRYALFLHNAALWRRDVMPVVYPSVFVPFQERRQRGVKKALKKNLVVNEFDNFTAYWDLLTSVLEQQHQVKPVHTLQEISYLKSLFSDNIKLYGICDNEIILAGVLCYQSERVWRAQYIASSMAGKEVGALDLIFAYLLEVAKKQGVYFDFGPCNEDNGRTLNIGLVEQKEGFGARAVVHDFYEIVL